MQTQPTPLTPREHASKLVNDFASKTANLESATADTRAQITTLTAALNQASAPFLLELANLEQEAKELALAHGPEIFGDKRSLNENGYILCLRETTAVQVEDEAVAIRMLKRDAHDAILHSNSHKEVEMACNACLRVTTELDREYITRHYDEAQEWFQQYGISMVDKLSASLKKAPPPRVAKATQTTAPRKNRKPKATEQAEEQEAA